MPVKMHVPGAATMAVGEEAVLFLEARQAPLTPAKGGAQAQAVTPGPIYRLVGMRQGKVKITTDPDTGERKAGVPGGKKGLAIPIPRDDQGGPKALSERSNRLRDAVVKRDGSLDALLELVRAVHGQQAAVKASAKEAHP